VNSNGCPGPTADCAKFGAATSGICKIDDSRFENPLNLLNSTGDYSGVPLGGIGVGFFDIAPDGEVKRVAINNAHQDGVLTDTQNGTFVAMWIADSTNNSNKQDPHLSAPNALVLHRTPAGGAAGEAGLGCLANYATNFTGLFPTATLAVDTPFPVTVRAWSALKPHDIENSSLPVVHVEVTITNKASSEKDMAAAFSWQDVISRSIFDASDDQLRKFYPRNKGQATCALDVNALMHNMWDGGSNCTLNGKTRCHDMDRAETMASALKVGASLEGLEQHTKDKKLTPNKLTMQQYNSRVAIMAQKQDEHDQVTLLRSYAVASDTDGVAAWRSFATTGGFPSSTDSQTQPLYEPSVSGTAAEEVASAVALKATVPAKSSRTFRFVIAWYATELTKAGKTNNLTYCGTTDVNRMYHNRFSGSSGLEDMLTFATNPVVRTALEAGTVEWQTPILESTMPTFLQFKLVNSG
jgi:uncharacterized protein (DUF608 family)